MEKTIGSWITRSGMSLCCGWLAISAAICDSTQVRAQPPPVEPASPVEAPEMQEPPAPQQQEAQEGGQTESQDDDQETAPDSVSRWQRAMDVELEYFSYFATTDPEDARNTWMMLVDSELGFRITPRLVVAAYVPVVVKNVYSADGRFWTKYPHEGVYLRRLWLRYQSDRFALFAGKYEPASGIRGHAPIFFGNYIAYLSLEQRIGGGGSVTWGGEGLGRHTLTGHIFFRDTSRLSAELWTARSQHRRGDGGAGNTERPDNYLVTLHGGTEDSEYELGYVLGGGVQQKGDGGMQDERIYMGSLYGAIPAGSGSVRLSVDGLSLQHASGELVDTNSLTAGLAYVNWPFSIGAAYSLRGVEPHEMDVDRRTDRIVEVVTRYELEGIIGMEAAYQLSREHGLDGHALGIVVRHSFD